jgi:hypothetical protein
MHAMVAFVPVRQFSDRSVFRLAVNLVPEDGTGVILVVDLDDHGNKTDS